MVASGDAAGLSGSALGDAAGALVGASGGATGTVAAAEPVPSLPNVSTPAAVPVALKSLPNSQVSAMAAATSAAAGTSAVIDMGLPVAGGAGQAAPAAGGARIWIGTLHSETDAHLYWQQQAQRFPDILKALQVELKPVDLGPEQGIWMKVLGGPFASADEAGRACQAIRQRSPADDCTVVSN